MGKVPQRRQSLCHTDKPPSRVPRGWGRGARAPQSPGRHPPPREGPSEWGPWNSGRRELRGAVRARLRVQPRVPGLRGTHMGYCLAGPTRFPPAPRSSGNFQAQPCRRPRPGAPPHLHVGEDGNLGGTRCSSAGGGSPAPSPSTPSFPRARRGTPRPDASHLGPPPRMHKDGLPDGALSSSLPHRHGHRSPASPHSVRRTGRPTRARAPQAGPGSSAEGTADTAAAPTGGGRARLLGGSPMGTEPAARRLTGPPVGSAVLGRLRGALGVLRRPVLAVGSALAPQAPSRGGRRAVGERPRQGGRPGCDSRRPHPRLAPSPASPGVAGAAASVRGGCSRAAGHGEAAEPARPVPRRRPTARPAPNGLYPLRAPRPAPAVPPAGETIGPRGEPTRTAEASRPPHRRRGLRAGRRAEPEEREQHRPPPRRCPGPRH